MENYIRASLSEAHKTIGNFLSDHENIQMMERAVKEFSMAIQQNNKIISCGNGGSMCDAMHFAEELSGRFRKERRSLPAMAISDPSYITCTANDYGFDEIFARFVEAFGQQGDVLLAISTSGNSSNVLKACIAAKSKKMKVVALIGKDGGKLKNLADHPIIVPHNIADKIQEVHIKIIHTFIEGIERDLFPTLYK